MKKKDDAKTMKKIDKSDMLALLTSFPAQCRKAKEIGERFSIGADYFSGCSGILFTGLGGSAIGADLIRSYLADEMPVPIFVNRNYTLPAFVSEKTLVIASSYSGNTEETVSAYKDARARGARMIAITSGGEIAAMASSDGIPLVTIPGGLPPRCALGYSFFPNLILISKLGLIPDQGQKIDAAIRMLERLRDTKVGPEVGKGANVAQAIARKLHGKFPVVYGGQDRIDSVVVRWRGQLAENSKAIASSHIFPEMNHNEIVGWQNPKDLMKKLIVVLLRDRGDHPRTAKRMDITKRLIENEGAKVLEVASAGESILERVFSLICIGDFVSYYLAILYGVDPTPVDRVTYLKKELAKV